ncbi:MAG: serine/threonine protein kinase [Deltaproteobacteria bacterium]|nr:serine/threonine protein kinase [Deltaproteobacteria bacterium]
MKPLDLDTIQRNIKSIRDLKPLAQGGQKIVFRASHDDYGEVVIKVILEPNERIQREIDIAISSDIPNTAHLYEWGKFDHDGHSILFIIEEYIEGVNLRDEMKAKGRLPTKQVLALIDTLLNTAVALEKEKLVHRDIKPENIMVCPDGSFKLLDFGIARHLAKSSLTPTGAHFGPHTAGYAAPEQFRNLKKEIDIRTDLFAIGVVAYEALAGRHPFSEGSRDHLDTLRRTETMIPDTLKIEGDIENQLVNFIALLMSKYPSRRPPSALHARQWFDSTRGAINSSTGD